MDHPNRKVQTFADDMTEAIHENRDGLIQKIIHEEEEREAAKKQFSPESPRNKRFFALGTLLFLIGLGVIGFTLFNRESFVFQTSPRFIPIIFNDDYVFFDIGEMSKEEMASTALRILSETEVDRGGILGVYPALSGRALNFSAFLERIGANFRPSRENFVNENFMLGAFVSEAKPPRPVDGRPPRAEGNLFMLFQTRSFVDVFDDMRVWEDRMFSDLRNFFGIEINAQTAHLLTKRFVDGVVHNKNARILYYDEGEIALMYVFADYDSIVITSSPDAVREVVLRLAGSRVRK